jgi:hypothetical protein
MPRPRRAGPRLPGDDAPATTLRHEWERLFGRAAPAAASPDFLQRDIGYATRLLRLAWLAPDIVEAILGGCQPENLTASRLIQDTRIPSDWPEQRRVLGFA